MEKSTLINCDKCGYSWVTKSELLFVSCPSCMQKVKNEQKEGNEYEQSNVS